MKIENASLQFSTTSQQRSLSQRQQSAAMQISGRLGGRLVTLEGQYGRQENVRIESAQSQYVYSRSQISSAQQPCVKTVLTREAMLQSMVSHAFSRQVRISALAEFSNGPTAAPTNRGTGIATQVSVAYGQAYRYESEQQSALTLEGRITLADQRTIDFVLHTRMDNHLLFESGSGEFARFALRTDPLILNLQGGGAQLTDAAFEFDLDNDGSTESISMATAGSGFLAFDRNNDGKINNGSELFGTRNGDGFAELAQYDDDGNGFIDEADAIYAQLKLWSRDEDGTDRLTTLADAGVSAIGLQNAATPLALRGQSAQELGTIRSTGIFVLESGAIGTLQQVDLAQRDMDAEALFAADFENAQFIPPDPATTDTTPERQQLDDVLTHLRQLQEDARARLDALDEAESKESRSLLQQLVDSLEQQIRDQPEQN